MNFRKLMIMQAEASQIYSPEEYLELEINSEECHEYIKRKIIQMTGGTPNHNQIALNLSGKFTAYRTMPSFQEYLLIDQYRIYIEHYSKTEPHKWVFIIEE